MKICARGSQLRFLLNLIPYPQLPSATHPAETLGLQLQAPSRRCPEQGCHKSLNTPRSISPLFKVKALRSRPAT